MLFTQKASSDGTLSYLFGCASLGKSVAVDVVAGDESWFLEVAESAQTRITHVIDTHVHADHFSGGRELASLSGARYCLHDSADVQFPFLRLHDQDVIEAGNVRVEVLHTPGHTRDSICLLVTDVRRGSEPWFLLTGDTLLVGSVGFPAQTHAAHELAGMMYDSLHHGLLKLRDDLEFFPGHKSEGSNNAVLSGKPSSTLGFEKRNNSLLAIQDRDQFIRRLTRYTPPMPMGSNQIVLINSAA